MSDKEPLDHEEITEKELAKLVKERDMLRQAIRNAIERANGRESEWGDRAEECFAILEEALNVRWNRL